MSAVLPSEALKALTMPAARNMPALMQSHMNTRLSFHGWHRQTQYNK